MPALKADVETSHLQDLPKNSAKWSKFLCCTLLGEPTPSWESKVVPDLIHCFVHNNMYVISLCWLVFFFLFGFSLYSRDGYTLQVTTLFSNLQVERVSFQNIITIMPMFVAQVCIISYQERGTTLWKEGQPFPRSHQACLFLKPRYESALDLMWRKGETAQTHLSLVDGPS